MNEKVLMLEVINKYDMKRRVKYKDSMLLRVGLLLVKKLIVRILLGFEGVNF